MVKKAIDELRKSDIKNYLEDAFYDTKEGCCYFTTCLLKDGRYAILHRKPNMREYFCYLTEDWELLEEEFKIILSSYKVQRRPSIEESLKELDQ